MAHIRQQLRTEVQALLTTALSVPVFVSRTHVIQPSELPCAIITTDKESTERYASNKSLNREVQLTIRLYERAYENVDDLLDALCAKVEVALNNDTTIGANSILLNATGIDIEDGDQQIGVASMLYTVQFLSIQDPEQII